MVIQVARAMALGALTLLLASCAQLSQEACGENCVDASQWVAHPSPVVAEKQMREQPTHIVSFDTTEGTAMNVDVSPDGETLVFDLLGDIYVLPFAGGEAVALTHGTAWDQGPRFSLDGKSVYFVSDRVGSKNLWQLTLSNRLLRQVTHLDVDINIMGAPNWSQGEGGLLAGVHPPDHSQGETILHSIDPDDGSMTPVAAPEGNFINFDTMEKLRPQVFILSGAASADGEVYFSQVHFARMGSRVKLQKFDSHSQTHSVLTPEDANYSEYKPQLSHGGALLAYFRQYDDGRTEVRVRHRNTEQDEAIIELSDAPDSFYTLNDDAQPNYAFTPDDEHLVFSHGGKIRRLRLSDGSSEVIPFHAKIEREVVTHVKPDVQQLSDNSEAKIIRWPSLSSDGQTMAFVAIGYVWLMESETGVVRRLTHSNGFEHMAAISPDGKSVAFIRYADFDDERASLRIADVRTGEERVLLAEPDTTYLLPNWSQDGSMLALIRETKTEEGTAAAFGWVASTGSEFHAVASGPSLKDRNMGQITTYARFVGFNETADNLLFSFQRLEADTYPFTTAKTVLVSAGLDGGNQRTLAISTSDIGGISPSPDLNHLALTRDDGTAWVVPFSVGEAPVVVSATDAGARRLSDSDGYYLHWSRSDLLTFGFGQDVYRYGLGGGDLQRFHTTVTFERPESTRPIALIGARLVTMAVGDEPASVIESGTLVVDGKRIVAIGSADEVAIPPDAIIIDAGGKTIIPGLLDTHYHRIAGQGTPTEFMLPGPDFSDRDSIEYGVTSAWEPAKTTSDSVPSVVDLWAAGRILGPRWSYAGASVEYPRELFTNYAAGFATTVQYHKLGVTVVKEYGANTRQQRQWLSAAARELGVGIVAHLDSYDGMMTRAVDGFTGGDHPHIPVPFFKDVRELLKQTGFIWTANIAITAGVLSSGSPSEYFCQALSEHAVNWNRSAAGKIEQICLPDTASPEGPYHIGRFARLAEHVATAAASGVQIGVSAHNMPASNLHREMWLLWKGGMPIEEVLRATTMVNAEKLGLQEEVGTLEVGKIADFLVLDENPLDDILNTLSLKYTVQGGVVYDSATAERIDVSSLSQDAEGQTIH